MDHLLYSAAVVKQFLVQNGHLYGAIMDKDPDIMLICEDERMRIIYCEHIQGSNLEQSYMNCYKAHEIEQAKVTGTTKYDSPVVVDLDRIIRKYGWKLFVFGLIEIAHRAKARSLTASERDSWVNNRNKISSLNKTIKYS